ncbi:OLC1v1021459C1 [Oldenlandia corymbosa var. corymbosa]|uniref:OLC1v1021459C1 n=1 Tax=Oldenlandia corymbosa var. corymbosa TaxID=529605 RepID=A0AAV1BXZ9_OLDCO|nr:OLC1v1021459C1 [Oldenlandia corymbosa var. corymbosa]
MKEFIRELPSLFKDYVVVFPRTFSRRTFCLFGDDSVIIIVSSIFSSSPPEGFILDWNMVIEITEAPNGWPLGLGNINLRLIVTPNSLAARPSTPGEQSPTEAPSPSFSSFSSSNLDTESSASFFPDKSVSLGLLMGIRPGNRGTLQFPNSMDLRQNRSLSTSNAEVSRTEGVETSQGLCVPLLQNTVHYTTYVWNKFLPESAVIGLS